MKMVQELRRRGLRLTAIGTDRLAVEPSAALTDELRALIRSNKLTILAALDAERDAEFSDATTSCTTPNEQALERRALRQRRVERMLVDNGGLRIAWDADGPPQPEPGEPVSVVIAVRTRAGIVSGELLVPRERFDAALFFRTLEGTGAPS